MADKRIGPADDETIRRALIKRLVRQIRPGVRTSIIHELGLRKGRARIDVAVVTNEGLHGYEIKSDRDDTSRLQRQSMIYESVLDRVTLVAGEKAARWALRRIPEWWEVIIGKTTANGVRLTQARRGRRNRNVNVRALIELLWRDETLALLERHDIDRGIRSKPRGAMWNHATVLLDTRTIRRAVTDTLHDRDFRRNWGESRRVRL